MGLEKCCGLCVCPWSRARNFERSSGYSKTWKSSSNTDDFVNTSGPPTSGSGGAKGGKSGPYITKILDDAREDEMEENMGDIAGLVGNLKNMAVDMGTEIDAQNRQLDRINDKGESLTARVETADKRAKNILRNK